MSWASFLFLGCTELWRWNGEGEGSHWTKDGIKTWQNFSSLEFSVINSYFNFASISHKLNPRFFIFVPCSISLHPAPLVKPMHFSVLLVCQWRLYFGLEKHLFTTGKRVLQLICVCVCVRACTGACMRILTNYPSHSWLSHCIQHY